MIVTIMDLDCNVDVLDGINTVTQYVQLLLSDHAICYYGNSMWEFEVCITQVGACIGTSSCMAGIYFGGAPIIQTGSNLVVTWANAHLDGAGVINMVEGGYIIGYMNFPNDCTYTLNFCVADNKIYWDLAKWARQATSGQDSLL
jgi:hypothetical protein